ncbi:hypothetical protein LCGC14_0867800 [marine sediment metagenome]|uniref:Uncharacterized protein n=1 Tax=marine sediment metagenome TaxID=412755 RepID=A0A0F9P5I5_9ZZZZ
MKFWRRCFTARKNKKGSLQDLLVIMVLVVAFAVGTLIVYKVSDEINTKFQESTDITPQGKTAFSKINNMYPGVIDNSFLLLIIGLCIVALSLAMMVRVHPIFFVFFLIVFIIVIFLCGVFSNIYLEIANNEEMSDVAGNLKFITNIMGKLPLFIGILGFLLAGVMYKLRSMDQQ